MRLKRRRKDIIRELRLHDTTSLGAGLLASRRVFGTSASGFFVADGDVVGGIAGGAGADIAVGCIVDVAVAEDGHDGGEEAVAAAGADAGIGPARLREVLVMIQREQWC